MNILEKFIGYFSGILFLNFLFGWLGTNIWYDEPLDFFLPIAGSILFAIYDNIIERMYEF